MQKLRQFYCVAVVLSLGFGARVQAAEFGANTPYYEDDSWFDITEWFDGNDYNPTDEAWWRWDDETYHASEDVAGDSDSDVSYGFLDGNENEWYYDYYDPNLYGFYDYDNNDIYESGARYYDFDKDGFYDAYASYSDLDGDGVYEEYDFYSFTDVGSDKQKQQAQKTASGSSREKSVSGTIQKTKLVKTRGGKQHVIVAIQPQGGQENQPLIADLGKADDLNNTNPKLGDKIAVKGPQAKVGEHSVVLARSFDLNGQSKQVNRSARTITAKVADTHKAKIRGQEHLIAMVEASNKGQTQKIAVDLGPADKLNMKVNKGSTLVFSGFPVKVKNKPLIMAQSIQQGDQLVQINRQSSAVGKPGETQQGQRGQNQDSSGSDKSSTENARQPDRR